MRLWKKIAIGVGGWRCSPWRGFTYMVGGPRNLIGMIRYDQREEGPAQGRRQARRTSRCSRSTARRRSSSPSASAASRRSWSSAASPDLRSAARSSGCTGCSEKYGEHAQFLTLYIKEAHPLDEWQMESNEKEDVCYPQPTSLADRTKIANDFVKRFRLRAAAARRPDREPGQRRAMPAGPSASTSSTRPARSSTRASPARSDITPRKSRRGWQAIPGRQGAGASGLKSSFRLQR